MALVNWRSGKHGDETTDRPSLDAVLDHYEATYKPHKDRQVIRCLFHEDRTPSMSIAREAGLWHCFSCGQGGTTWDLIMLKEEIKDFRDARAFATALGLATEGTERSDDSVRESPYGFRPSRRVASGKGDRRGGRAFRPSWRRD